MGSKASALIIALMMVLVLSIVSVSLLNFVSFYYLDSWLLYEREKLKLILSKEVLETIKLVQSGVLNFTNEMKTNTGNFVYEVSREISFTNNVYNVNVSLKSSRARISRKLSFFVLLPTDFCYINFSDVEISNKTKGVFWGYSFFNRLKNISDDTFFAFYYPPLFSSTTNVLSKSYISSAEVSPETPFLSLNIKFQTNFVNEVNVRISVDEIIKKSVSIVYKHWIINDYYKYDTEDVYNSVLMDKSFLGVFFYSNPKLKVNYQTLNNLYFSSRKGEKLGLENMDVFDPRGEMTKKFTFIENGYLYFNSSPVEVNLPQEAFSEPFKVKLNLKDLRLVGKYRRIIGVFFDTTNRNLLNNGIVLKDGILEILSDEIKRKYYESVGIGNGIKRKFAIGKDTVPQKVFVGGKKVQSFFVENFELVLSEPPRMGEEVLIMKKIPRLFIQKSLPPDGVNVFYDKIEKCVVIDFDKIQNLPKNKVIFSYLPLVVRGSPNEPIIVVSTENVYIDEVNNSSNPKSLVVIAGKGVFLKEYVEVLRNVLIVSRLDGIYRVIPSGFVDPSNERNKWVFGTVILTGEVGNDNSKNYKRGYVLSFENHINNSTFSISDRLARDYTSNSEFGNTLRYLLPPIVVLRGVR